MKLLTSTALALTLSATAAMADSHLSNDMMAMQGELIRSSDVTGGAVYTTDAAADEGWDTDAYWDEIGTDWNQIGEIEDIVMTRDGQVTGIVAEVGGFLDIGDKEVMISIDDLNLAVTDEDDYAYVTRLSEEDLEALEGVGEEFWD